MSKELFIPVAISEKTKAFMPRSMAQKFAKDLHYLVSHHEDLKSLTLPSGLVLTQPSIEGKMSHMFSHYARQTHTLLKGMSAEDYEKTVKIHNVLAKKGILTEEHLAVFPESEKKIVHVLVPRTHPSLYQSAGIGHMTKQSLGEYYSAISALHSAGWLHGHPHFSNIFKDERTGKLGIHDFSLAQKRQVDWKSAKSIAQAFKEDHEQMLDILVRESTEHNDWFEKLKQHQIREFITPMTDRLPITEKVRQQLLERFEVMVFRDIVPFLQSHGYFEHKGRGL